MSDTVCIYKKSEVCIRAKSTPALIQLKGQVTKHSTVTWTKQKINKNKNKNKNKKTLRSETRFKCPLRICVKEHAWHPPTTRMVSSKSNNFNIRPKVVPNGLLDHAIPEFKWFRGYGISTIIKN